MKCAIIELPQKPTVTKKKKTILTDKHCTKKIHNITHKKTKGHTNFEREYTVYVLIKFFFNIIAIHSIHDELKMYISFFLFL